MKKGYPEKSPLLWSGKRSPHTAGAALFIPPFDLDGDDAEELETRLLQEALLIRSILALREDQEKLAVLVQRYPTTSGVSAPLDHDSEQALKGCLYCVTPQGMSKQEAMATVQRLHEYLPNTVVELVEIRDHTGQRLFALKGISAPEANAVEKMHRVRTRAEELLRRRGQTPPPITEETLEILERVKAMGTKVTSKEPEQITPLKTPASAIQRGRTR